VSVAALSSARLLGTSTFRWLLGYALVFVAIAAVIFGALFWQTNDLLTRRVLQTIAVEVQGLREQFRAGGPGLLVKTLTERSRTAGPGLYYLSSPFGAKAAGNLPGVPIELSGNGVSGLFSYLPPGETSGEPRLGAGVAIEIPGDYVLVVGRDVEDQRAFVVEARRLFLAGLALIGLLGIGGGVLASRRLLRRIDRMSAASTRIMAGDLSGRVPVTGSGDELDRLAQSLNQMLARIEELMAGLREVSDNIAHDLRTPLNRLRNRAEEALRAGDHRAALERNIEEADDLIRTFNALLSIARLEAGAARESLMELDLAGIVRDAADLYEPLLEEAGLELEATIESGITVRADRQLVTQAIANLLDNAIKYGGGSGPVTVTLSRAGDMAELTVADRGPGIPAADRERALKRFVRLETSRTRPGSGLGLSLVSAVARLHGGSVRLEDNEPGLRVVVELPAHRHRASVK
jgi:signal transduction histidine kinase